MKVRNGFVTNSSSTNFIIMSKNEITVDLLYKSLGFKSNSLLGKEGIFLCENLLTGMANSLSYFNIDKIDYKSVETLFGKYCADKFNNYYKKGYNIYIGRTSSGDSVLTDLFTCSSFEIKKHDIYIYARECVW